MASSSRRNFLQATATGAFGLAATSAIAGQAPRPAPAVGNLLSARDTNRISILSYSFLGLFKSGRMDIFGYLESCRHRYGLDAANIWNGMLTSMDEDYLKKVRRSAS